MKIKRSLTGLTFAVAAMLLTACGRTEINVNDYLSAETKGANSRGSVEWTLNTAAMVTANPEAFRLKDNASLTDISAVTEKINANLYGAFDKAEALSNGDTVNFVWDTSNVKVLEKAYKVKLLTENYPVTISGLPELQQYDPFEYITIEYLEDGDGVQPIIRIADDIPFRLNYAVRQDGTLHIGDSFIVEVSRKIDGRDLTQQDLADFLLEQGFEITQSEKEYLVPSSLS